MQSYLDIAKQALKLHKAQTHGGDSGGTNNELNETNEFSQAPEEIKDILNDVERDGIAVRWWNLVDDMVLFYEDEESLRLAPHGIVMYSKRELDLLFGEAGPTPGHMRLIHEAKRAGARVIEYGQRS